MEEMSAAEMVSEKEDRGQRTEDRGQRTEDRGQRTEDRGQRTEEVSGSCLFVLSVAAGCSWDAVEPVVTASAGDSDSFIH